MAKRRNKPSRDRQKHRSQSESATSGNPPGDRGAVEGLLGDRMRRRDEAPHRRPHLNVWKQLYEMADQVKTLAPWDFMDEADIFGIEIPGTGERVYASVMGQLGEHLAVGVYVGDTALYEFLDVLYGEAEVDLSLLEIPQIQLSFEDREMIQREDRAVMKQLRLSGRYRGSKAYPQFCTYRPGYAPWVIDASEADVLLCTLEQLLDVAPRFRTGDVALGISSEQEYLVRASVLHEEVLAWEDRRVLLPDVDPLAVEFGVNELTLRRLKDMPDGGGEVQVGLFSSGAVVQARRTDRPEMTYLLMVVDKDSRMILGTEMLTMDPDMPGLLAKVPEKVLETVARADAKPATCRVGDVRLAGLLGGVCQDLGIDVVVGETHLLDHIRESVTEFMGRG